MAPNASVSQSSLSRRSLLKGLVVMPLALSLSQLAGRDAIAAASIPDAEMYHIFVPPQRAQQGGTQAFRTLAGEEKTVRIPKQCRDGRIVTKRQGFGPELRLTIHTLDESQGKISQQIGSLIEFQALRPESQQRCVEAYQRLRHGEFIEDLAALALLDFLVTASALDDSLQQQYRIASFNARTVGLAEQLTRSLEASHLKRSEKQAIWAAAEAVRSSKPVFDLAALRKLDSIMQGSDLPTSLRQQYALASSTSRALTADIVILNLIQQSYGDRAAPFIESYRQVRDGETVRDDETIQSLDTLIKQASISPEIQLVYFLARNNTLEQIQAEWATNTGDAPDLLATSKQLYTTAQNIVPVSQSVLGAIGASTTTGVTVSSLAGAVGTNATLSVMGGGLGMLGGLGVVTGGASLLGAATLLMALNASQLERKEQIHLGIAAATGVTGSAAAVATAWSLVGTYGVASTGTAISSLSGAAAYSATLSALGGTSALTGGAALLAFGMGYGMWLLLQSQHSQGKAPSPEVRAKTLEQLELLLYTVQDELISSRISNRYPVAPQLATALGDVADHNLLLAPHVPLKQLKRSLKRFSLASNEVILACYESYGFGWGDNYEGFILSDRRIFWKRPSQPIETAKYGEADYLMKIQSLLDIDFIRKQTALYQLFMSFAP